MKTLPLNRRRFLASVLAVNALSSLQNTWAATQTSTFAAYICVTCGSQFTETSNVPEACPVCLDERQYVGLNGQQWTTLEKMRKGEWENVIREQEIGIHGIGTEPKFAIGQRALLLQTSMGNILWDCISYIDDETIKAVKDLGGIAAIAISHPHYYGSMVEWSRAFNNAPIYLHEADQKWVMRPDDNIHFWSGETKELAKGLQLVRTGGHFEGFQVLHWKDANEGRGILFSGDQPIVAADRKWVSFMYSYPNYVPLNATQLKRIATALEPLNYDRIYSAWWPTVIKTGGKNVVEKSMQRYLNAISG